MPDISSSLGTDFYASANGNLDFEILRKCHWKVDISGIDSRISAQECTMPRIELEETEVYYYNDRIKLASKPNPGEFNLQVLDFVSPAIVDQFWAWFILIYDPDTRNMGYANKYKRSAILNLYDPNSNLIRQWTLIGLWPKNSPTPNQAYTYEAGQEAVKIEMGFACDMVKLTKSASGAGGAGGTLA